MRLDLRVAEGTFSGTWRVFADSWIVLPGDLNRWPEQVEVNGRAHAVIERKQQPSGHLAAGSYTITGEFVWAELPEALVVPPDAGLVTLKVQGGEIAFPRINRKGEIWLGQTQGRAQDNKNGIKNSHFVIVQRRIIDEIPLQIRTRIELDVTGEQRELVLGRPLLDGSIPIAINSLLPARIESSGELRVQLRPGRHVIEVHTRHPAGRNELLVPNQTLP